MDKNTAAALFLCGALAGCGGASSDPPMSVAASSDPAASSAPAASASAVPAEPLPTDPDAGAPEAGALVQTDPPDAGAPEGSPTRGPALPSCGPIELTPSGSVPARTWLTLSAASAGARLYYTTDGSAPTTASTQYTTQLQVLQTEQLTVLATAPGVCANDTQSWTVTVLQPKCDSPVASFPANPTPDGATGAALSDTDSAVTIYYSGPGVSSLSMLSGTAWDGGPVPCPVSYCPAPAVYSPGELLPAGSNNYQAIACGQTCRCSDVVTF